MRTKGVWQLNPISSQTIIPGARSVWRCSMQQFSSLVVSPNPNSNIVMFLAEALFVRKMSHNVVPFHCPCLSFLAQFAAQCCKIQKEFFRLELKLFFIAFLSRNNINYKSSYKNVFYRWLKLIAGWLILSNLQIYTFDYPIKSIQRKKYEIS